MTYIDPTPPLFQSAKPAPSPRGKYAGIGKMVRENLAAQRHSETSKQAAESMEPSAPSLREKVYDHIRSRGAEGSTDEECQIALGMSGNTQRVRRTELCDPKRGVRVVDSGRTRKTKAGNPAVVWVVTEKPC